DHTFLLALAVLEQVRQENLDQAQDKIGLAARKFSLFPARVGVLQRLFALERRREDLEAAFWTAELGTARAFLEALGQRRAEVAAAIGLRPCKLAEARACLAPDEVALLFVPGPDRS